MDPLGRSDTRLENLLLPLLLLAFGAAAGATAATSPLSALSRLELAPTPVLPAPASGEPKGPEGYLRLEVVDVVLAEEAATSAVLLSAAGADIVLPLFLAEDAGRNLQARLDRSAAPCELAQALSRNGGKVLRVQLEEGHEGPIGRVIVHRPDGESVLDANLDDALSIALAHGAHVWVAPALVDLHGFQTDLLPRRRSDMPSHLRTPARI